MTTKYSRQECCSATRVINAVPITENFTSFLNTPDWWNPPSSPSPREAGVTTKADDNPVRVDAPDNTYTIGGLKSDTPYTITVTVVNPAGSMTSPPITRSTEKGN